jgi:hypothetical protein
VDWSSTGDAKVRGETGFRLASASGVSRCKCTGEISIHVLHEVLGPVPILSFGCVVSLWHGRVATFHNLFIYFHMSFFG